MTKLYRSRTDRRVTGLCGGLAETLNIDSTLLRVLVVGTTFLSGGVVVPIYFLAALVIPSEPWAGGPYGPAFEAHGGGCGGSYGNPWGQSFASWKQWKKAEKHYRKAQRYGWTPPHERAEYEGHYSQAAAGGYGQEPNTSDLDDMMKDIEKKAMRKEIEELRAKVAAYEKQQNQQTKGDV